MSSEAVMYEHVDQEPGDGLMNCPHCDYKIPENLVICWRCGKRVEKPDHR